MHKKPCSNVIVVFFRRGGADLLKKEAHIEVPNFQTILTKPQFVLMSHIADSWASSMTKEGKMAPIPRAIVGCVFYPNGKHTWICCWSCNYIIYKIYCCHSR